MTGRRGRRRRKLLDDLKEIRGCSHLKEEALDRTMWRAHFGRAFGPVVRQTTKQMNSRILPQLHSDYTKLVCDASISAQQSNIYILNLTTNFLENFSLFDLKKKTQIYVF